MLLLFSSREAIAQQQLYANQQHFGVEEGLPQSYISGIIQDKDGFIWLSTLDGLCRYDGRGFKTFRYSTNDSTGLATNTINNLGPLINNTLTIYYSAIQADDFNLRTFKVNRNIIREKIRSIPNSLWQMSGINNTSANWLFIMAHYNGVGWLNSISGKTYYANKANGLLQQDTVSAIIE